MKALVRLQLVLAILFTVAGLAFPAWYRANVPPPKKLQDDPAVVQGIQSIQDIEHLRRLALNIVRNSDNLIIATAKASEDAVNVIGAVAELAGALFALSFFILYFTHRKSSNP